MSSISDMAAVNSDPELELKFAADLEAERVAQAQLKLEQASLKTAEIEVLNAKKAEMKKQNLLDYLKGQTRYCFQCKTQRTSVGNKLICESCLNESFQKQFNDECAKPTNAWYVTWRHRLPTHLSGRFICRVCLYVMPIAETGVIGKDGRLEPIIACCTQTNYCKAAQQFWGSYNQEPHNMLLEYIKSNSM